MKTKTSKGNQAAISRASELLKLASKVGHLACELSREPEEYRLAGRLNRLVQFPMSELTEGEITAFAESHVRFAMTEGDPFLDRSGFYPLQSAIAQVSYRIWEDLWNNKHPERVGMAWHGQDLTLMSVWRMKVLELMKECHQGETLAMSAKEYTAALIASGASEEAAEGLSGWLSEIKYEGTTPSTEVVSEIET